MFNQPLNQNFKKINPIQALKSIDNLQDKIYNSSLEDFIIFAKQYNIFQNSTNEFYKSICDKIKQRLQKENLTEDDVRPQE